MSQFYFILMFHISIFFVGDMSIFPSKYLMMSEITNFNSSDTIFHSFFFNYVFIEILFLFYLFMSEIFISNTMRYEIFSFYLCWYIFFILLLKSNLRQNTATIKANSQVPTTTVQIYKCGKKYCIHRTITKEMYLFFFFLISRYAVFIIIN